MLCCFFSVSHRFVNGMLINWSKIKPEQFAKLYRKHHLVPEWSPRSFPSWWLRTLSNANIAEVNNKNSTSIFRIWQFYTIVPPCCKLISLLSPRPWISLNSVMCKKCLRGEHIFWKILRVPWRQGIQCGGLADASNWPMCRLQFFIFAVLFINIFTHRIHVWYIYANIGGVLMVNVIIYTIHGSYGLDNFLNTHYTFYIL